MRATFKPLPAVKITALLISLFSYTYSFGQDISLSDHIISQIFNTDNKFNGEINYPDCPLPVGVLRFQSSQSETITFAYPPVSGQFYYILLLEYDAKTTPKQIEIKEGSKYELDYNRYGLPQAISVKRVCQILGDPFIYHSAWQIVPVVNTARNGPDTICNDFNGADVLHNPTDSSFTINSTYENRSWSNYTIRFLINITYCNLQDTAIFITDFPYVFTADGTICSMTITLQYQSLNTTWYDCEEFNIYEDDNNGVLDSSCDGNHPEIDLSNTTLITSLQGEDSFYVAGFKVKILSLSGALSGMGLLTLPFQDKKLLINFENLQINDDLLVVGLSGNSSISAVVNGNVIPPTGSFSLGEEACIPPQDEAEWDENGKHSETGEDWDPNGFGQNGQYIKEPPYEGYEEGDPYDPNYDPCGFNSQGIHRVTQTKYNEDGCSMLKLDKDKQLCHLNCVPYYWLQEPESTLEGIAFYNAKEPTLGDKVDSILIVISNEVAAQLNQKMSSCNTMATIMRAIVVEENLDSNVIFGDNSEYINPGLSTEFVSAPESSLLKSQRNENIVELEDLHVDLYTCDQERIEIVTLQELLQEISAGDGKVGLMSFLEVKIKSFTASQVQQYSSQSAWLTKLRQLIDLYISNSLNGINGYGFNELFEKEKSYYSIPEYRETFRHSISNNPHSLLSSLGLAEFIRLNVAPIVGGGGNEAFALPLEITRFIEGSPVKIIITKIGFGAEFLTVDAHLIYNLPNGAEQLIFKCEDLRFSPNGFIDKAKLILGSTTRIKLLNNVANLILNADSTFVEWNCNGFEKLNVVGYIEFCNNVLLPIDPTTDEPYEDGEHRVKAYFQTTITKLDGFYVAVTIDEFALASAKSVRCTIENAVLDMSTTQSPTSAFPIGYTNEHSFLGPDGLPYVNPLWKGFYLEHLNITVSGGLSLNDDDIIVDMFHAVIDDRGFSGLVGINYSILDLGDSNFGGWAFSIDTFNLHFLFNQLVGGGFGGLINVPIFKFDCNGTANIEESDCFDYSVQFMSGADLQFSVAPKSEMCIPIFTANVLLDKNSILVARKTEDDYFLEANLSGKIYFNGIAAQSVDTIRFQEVKLRNKAPYFSVGLWQFDSLSREFGPFVISIKDMILDTVPNEINKSRLSLIAGFEINDKYKLAATGGISILGDLVTTGGRQRWVYEKTIINGLYLKTEIGGTKLEGALRYLEDQGNFGNLYKAALKVKFAKLDVEVRAMGLFGKVDDFSYFNVDAIAAFEPAIPVVGPFKMSALGGGLSYNMAESETLLGLPYNMDIENDSVSIFNMPIGQSLTGTIYQPQNNSVTALRLIVAGIIQDSSIVSFNAIFQIEYGGGMKVSLKGTAKLMKGLSLTDIPFMPDFDADITSKTLEDWEPPNVDAVVRGYFSIVFNSGIGPESKPSIDGAFALYLTVGTEQNKILYGKAMAELHIDENEWYFNLGRLKNMEKERAELTLDIAILVIKVQAYLNIGTGIPPMPDPPKIVKDIFGNISSPDASLGFGTGFAFGLAVAVELDIPIIIGSIELDAGFGFDLSMKQYDNAFCGNTGDEIGINGWYTTGQAYLYIRGNVKLLGAKLLGLDAAVLVQTGFPNPSWVSGNLSLEYKILFVRGNIRAKIQYGEKCVPIGELESSFPPIIYNVLPMTNSTDVDPLATIHVDFNIPMDYEFSYTENEVDIPFRTEIEFLELKSERAGVIATDFLYDDDHLHLELIPEYIMPSNDSLTFTIRVKVFKNNVEVTELDGIERIVGFTTSRALSIIPLSNINYTYPISGMNNFYRKEYEYEKGYVQLNRNQYDLAYPPSGKKLAIILSSPTQKLIGVANYETSLRTIDFPLPSSKLNMEEFYKVELGITDLEISNLNNELIQLSSEQYKQIQTVWNATFRVSSYETFFEKIEGLTNAMNLSSTVSLNDFYNDCAAFPIEITEPFDEIEILPIDNSPLAYLKEKKATLIQIGLNMDSLSNHTRYSEEWAWIDDILQNYSDPLIKFTRIYYNNSSDRFSGLQESVFIGPSCQFDPDYLHPPFTEEQFNNLSGVSALQSFVEPAQLSNLENSSGNSIDPHNEELAASQYLIINTPRYFKNLFQKSRGKALWFVFVATQACLKYNEENGRSVRDYDPQSCPGNWVWDELLVLSGGSLSEPSPPYIVKLPIRIAYTLPGINLTTSIHNLVYTYTIP